jgi:hypothetical protein
MTFEGHEVIGHEIVVEQGSFRKERFWLAGWINIDTRGAVQYVHGYSGKETMITIDYIRPLVTFDVI